MKNLSGQFVLRWVSLPLVLYILLSKVWYQCKHYAKGYMGVSCFSWPITIYCYMQFHFRICLNLNGIKMDSNVITFLKVWRYKEVINCFQSGLASSANACKWCWKLMKFILHVMPFLTYYQFLFHTCNTKL
jgi:hypothetical protein